MLTVVAVEVVQSAEPTEVSRYRRPARNRLTADSPVGASGGFRFRSSSLQPSCSQLWTTDTLVALPTSGK